MEKFWLLLKEPYKEESSIHPYPEEAPAYPAAMRDDKPTAVAYSGLAITPAHTKRLGRLQALRSLLARIIHERFCCNRRSAATTSLRPEGSQRGSAISRRTIMNNAGYELAFFRAVNDAEADTFRVLVVQTFEGVAVKDADDLASEGGS